MKKAVSKGRHLVLEQSEDRKFLLVKKLVCFFFYQDKKLLCRGGSWFCWARLCWARQLSQWQFSVCACIRLILSGPQLLQLLIDFKIISHDCSPSGVDMPFETFVQVGPRSRSHLKVKFFVWTITCIILDGLQYKFAQLFSIINRCAIWNICSGRPKVKVTLES